MKLNNETYKIEHNIPLPPREKPGAVATILRQMKPGDSVLITKGKASAWHCAAIRCKMKVATRKVSPTQSRVWKVA